MFDTEDESSKTKIHRKVGNYLLVETAYMYHLIWTKLQLQVFLFWTLDARSDRFILLVSGYYTVRVP